MEKIKNDIAFSEARRFVLSDGGGGHEIGRLSEKTLHRILKYYIEPNDAFHEIAFMGSVADIKNSKGIFEIQTRSTERLNPKLSKFLAESRVTLVLPLAAEKRLSWLDTESCTISEPRKSPKTETLFDALFELSKIKSHLLHENFKLKLLFLSVSEFRYLNGYDKTKKHGSTRCERIPNKLISELDFDNVRELCEAVAKELPDGEFTAAEFKKLTRRTARRNHYILHFLLDFGVISRAGSRGKAFLYKK